MAVRFGAGFARGWDQRIQPAIAAAVASMAMTQGRAEAPPEGEGWAAAVGVAPGMDSRLAASNSSSGIPDRAESS